MFISFPKRVFDRQNLSNDAIPAEEYQPSTSIGQLRIWVEKKFSFRGKKY